MKPWLLAAAVLLPGGAIVALVVWLRRRWLARQHDPKIAELIQPPRPVYTKADERVRQRTEKRRQAANGIRARAARVESGSPVSDVLRAVK